MSKVRDKVARAVVESIANANSGMPYPNYSRLSKAGKRNARIAADTAIATFLEAIQEQGWQIVPKESTEEMREWGQRAIDHDSLQDGSFATTGYESVYCYRAMLAAAPEWKP